MLGLNNIMKFQIGDLLIPRAGIATPSCIIGYVKNVKKDEISVAWVYPYNYSYKNSNTIIWSSSWSRHYYIQKLDIE